MPWLGAPEELRVALLARGLDQPGVLVALAEDILAEGTTTAVLGTDIAVSTPPIAVPLLSSCSSVGCLLVPQSFASSSSVPSGKRARSRKVEKSRVSKKKGEVDEEALGRIAFATSARELLRPFLAPLCAFATSGARDSVRPVPAHVAFFLRFLAGSSE